MRSWVGTPQNGAGKRGDRVARVPVGCRGRGVGEEVSAKRRARPLREKLLSHSAPGPEAEWDNNF